MSKLRRALATAVLVLHSFAALAPLYAQTGEGDTQTLTILHTNDLHGHILPFAYTETGRSPDEQPSVGGAARRATLIRQIRKDAKNPVLLLDAGDTFTRGPFSTMYLGLPDIEAMNAVGYELAALGNNEFEAKEGAEMNDAAGAQAALFRDIKRSRFPWLCANCTDQHGAILEGVEPFVVRQYGPVRVGFLGLTAPRVANYPQAKGFTVIDPVAAAKTYIPLARAQCDVLIAITHIGLLLDEQLAAQTTGLDAIIGGDSHTFLYKPVEVKNVDKSAIVPIVQDGEYGVNVGRFDLHFARTATGWHLASYHEALLPVGPKLASAPDVDAVVAPYLRPLLRVVGTLPASKIGATPAARRRLTTQILADALRRQTGADFALNPSDSAFFEMNPLAASLFDVFRSPTVRLYDLNAIMPFTNHAVVATLTGSRLQAAIALAPDGIVSGDAARIDPAATYHVAFVDYVASSVYKVRGPEVRDTGKDVRDLVIADINR